MKFMGMSMPEIHELAHEIMRPKYNYFDSL